MGILIVRNKLHLLFAQITGYFLLNSKLIQNSSFLLVKKELAAHE
jgi:hypothetical protein